MATLCGIPLSEWVERSKWSDSRVHLYVIQEGESGPCKVGIARNAFWRRAGLQTGNCRPLNLRAVFEASGRHDAIVAEAAALKNFARQHLSGEWIDVGPALLISYLELEFGNGTD